MTDGETILYLSRADVARLDLTPLACLPVVEDAFRALHAGQAINGEKIGLFADPQTFSYAMPAILRGQGAAGVKWVSGADNAARGMPNISGVMPAFLAAAAWLAMQ